MSRPGPFESNKRRRTQQWRTPVDMGAPSTSPIPSYHDITSRVERLQPSTGRRHQSQRVFVSDVLGLPADDANIGLDVDESENNEALESVTIDLEERSKALVDKQKKKKLKSLASRRPMVLWKEGFRDAYLDEFLRWEGRGDAWCSSGTQCTDCVSRKALTPAEGKFRCSDCFVPHMLCKECCIRRHRMLPFHLVQEWTGATFVRSPLKELGLRLQLNHLSMKCSSPEPSHANLVVLHTNGLHEVSVDFCGCQPLSKFRQLLRRGLYPSSQENPRTCASFELLRHLQTLSLTSKCSTYDYYRALEKLSDDGGVKIPPSKYPMRHLKMLKRAGRGHDETGVTGTKEGELAILCPSCPRPGINLPKDWENAKDDDRFLYLVVLCIDANFRLKNQMVSNYSVDPGLGTGLSYTISRKAYEEYIKERVNDNDVDESRPNGCGLQAVDQANTKYNKGLRYTGVSGVSCGRSEMLMPCSVGNLQKGEKYANMDFACGSAMRFVYILLILLSYDIACKWFVNLANRIRDYWPQEIKPRPGVTLVPVIPKLHENGHKQAKGHEQFSCNLCPGLGHTDGECPERIWSAHNAVANATKTMGPGSRHDVLDDHFGFWNYGKYVTMGKTLMRRYQKALPERNRQVEAHRGFTESINPVDVANWTQTCKRWEDAAFPKDRTASPYHVEGNDLTQAQVRKELADEEGQRVSKGGIVYHDTSAAAFLANGLDIEDAQRRLTWVVKQKEKEASAVAEERTLLRKEVNKWRKIQAIYMPGLMQHLSDVEKANPGSTEDGERVEEARLWLPSSLAKADRDRICIPGLANAEERLRTAQCSDSLSSIRATLRLKSRMVQFKNKNVRGQRGGTRSRELINRVHNRARKYAARYRAARAAKLALTGPGPWETSFQVLRDSDIRLYQDPERLKPKQPRRGTLEDGEKLAAMDIDADGDDGSGIDLLPENRSRRDGTGQTRLSISWIWTVTSYKASSEEGNDDNLLRAEWARSRARVNRAKEEVKLLREEMRRVLAFLDWKAEWWISRQHARHVQDVVLAEGLRSYCDDQAQRQRALKVLFEETWNTPLEDVLPAEHVTSRVKKNKKGGEDEDSDSEDGDSEDGEDEGGEDEGGEGGGGPREADEEDDC